MTACTGFYCWCCDRLWQFVLPQGHSAIVVVLVGVSDLVFVRVLDLAACAFQSRMLAAKCAVEFADSATRLIGIAGLALAASHSTVFCLVRCLSCWICSCGCDRGLLDHPQIRRSETGTGIAFVTRV